MASLCVKTRRGKVEVHNNEVASALTLCLSTTEMDKINTKYEYMKRQKKTVKRPKSTPPVGSHNAPSMNTASLTKNITTMQEYTTCRHTKDFAEDLGDFLSHIDMMALRKKELLHKNWTDRVYEPIRRKIVEAMGSQQQTENYRRRKVLYQQFLEHVNKKGHVFLDTVDKREYNAQALNYHRPAPLSVYHPILKDPLHLQGMERSNEDQVILRCITGNIYTHKDLNQLKLPNLPLVPQGRHGTDSTSWLEMPLFNIESTPRKASRLRMNPQRSQTQIDFADWSSQHFDAHMVDHELQLQHKRMFEEKPPYGVPGRQFAKAPFASKTTSAELGSGLHAAPS